MPALLAVKGSGKGVRLLCVMPGALVGGFLANLGPDYLPIVLSQTRDEAHRSHAATPRLDREGAS